MATRFRLARVLRLRTQLRRQAQEQVGQIVAAMTAARREISAMHGQADAARAREEAALATGLPAEALRDGREWGGVLKVRAARLGEGLQAMGATLARARELVALRRREERQLERLAEQARERQQAHEARAEAVLVDELVLARRAADARGRG